MSNADANQRMAAGLHDLMRQPVECGSAPPAADLLAEFERAWRLVQECEVKPSYIVFAASLNQVRVRWRGKRMTRKVVAWPKAAGRCPRWAKERFPGVSK